MSPAGCSHVNGYKVDNWKQNLRVIYQCFVWSGTAETRRRKVRQSDAGWTELTLMVEVTDTEEITVAPYCLIALRDVYVGE
ncbi:ubiquitin carboxyl-terminal hydrolase 22-like isoform X1 [Lates japonicus]|uniref:Ubiquitin carboxyl-terminal hydrolase 22-like isoform X1 n=1 Tax=Lates japonicus TaxID=270547 RepID=A0AAD3N7B2_LATJO|nr:ubiquitin carboxyl-terminal hydrolase 22-like isoform X1 [Lates japonicus]